MYKSKEIYIDKERGQYKRYFRLLGIPFNEGWKPLPKILQVAVTQIAVGRTINSPVPGVVGNTGAFEDKDRRYFVFLLASKTNKIEVFRTEDHQAAIEFATPIAAYLEVSLVDHSQKKE